MNVGNRIKELRIKHDLTQRELSQKIHIAQNTLSQIENDIANPSYEVLNLIADFFQCSTDYLLGREDDLGVIQVYPQTDKLDTLNADEQKIIDFIRKNPPLNATEWIELYAELPRYMQESIFAELRGMHLGFKAAKTKNAAKK